MKLAFWKKTPPAKTFLEYFEERNAEIQKGALTRYGRPFTYGSRYVYKCTLNWVRSYHHHTGGYLASDMSAEWFEGFVRYLNAAKLRLNTQASIIGTMKQVLKRLHKRGLSTEGGEEVPNPEELTTKVYNSLEEIDALIALRLKGSERDVRDAYVVQCFSGLRFSDLRTLLHNLSAYTHEVDGRKYFRIVQKKTNGEVVIPVGAKAQALLDARQWRFGKIWSIQYYNRDIKAIARKAGLTQIVPERYTQGGVATTAMRPKCEMVSSHTARRSFATNAFLAGIPVLKIMKITGHKSESSFLRYIRSDAQQSAISLVDHPFFS